MVCVVSTTNSTVAARADRLSSDIPSSSRESLHQSRIAQRDHKPNRPRPRPRPRNQEETNRGRERRGGRGGRFMESPLSFFACIGTMNHPLIRPSGTLSPSEGERDGVRGRFMESRRFLGVLLPDHEALLTCPSPCPLPALQREIFPKQDFAL